MVGQGILILPGEEGLDGGQRINMLLRLLGRDLLPVDKGLVVAAEAKDLWPFTEEKDDLITIEADALIGGGFFAQSVGIKLLTFLPEITPDGCADRHGQIDLVLEILIQCGDAYIGSIGHLLKAYVFDSFF